MVGVACTIVAPVLRSSAASSSPLAARWRLPITTRPPETSARYSSGMHMSKANDARAGKTSPGPMRSSCAMKVSRLTTAPCGTCTPLGRPGRTGGEDHVNQVFGSDAAVEIGLRLCAAILAQSRSRQTTSA